MERYDLMEPVLEGAQSMMTTMFGVGCELAGPGLELFHPFVSGVINLSGASKGQLALTLPSPTARKMVAAMLMMTEDEVDDESLRDAVGELTNIMAGCAKEKLQNSIYRFNLSVPLVVMGNDHLLELFRSNLKNTVMLGSDFGPMALTVWLVTE